MRRHPAAPKLDRSRIVFGCANFGGIGSAPELKGRGQDEGAAWALLDAARDLGITRFDTANSYGGGESERILGRWLARQSPAFRASAVVFTKVGNPLGARRGRAPLSAAEIEFHARRSLRRLGRVDVYLLHQPDPSTPVAETARALKRAVDDGIIGSVGLSNVDAAYVREFLARSEEAGLRAKVSWVQNQFNVLRRDDADSLLPLLREAGLRYAAASPLAGGVLAGRYPAGEPAAPGSRLALRPDLYSEYQTAEAFERLALLRKQAAARRRPLAEEALRFVLSVPDASAVIGVSRVEQLAGLGLS